MTDKDHEEGIQRRHDEAVLEILNMATFVSMKFQVCLPCLLFNAAEVAADAVENGSLPHGTPPEDGTLVVVRTDRALQ